MRTVAALYVEAGGVYYALEGVDPWPVIRDARLYSGPHPVVAHPPCQRWGRYASGGPNASFYRRTGDDGRCFELALDAVRRFGGVLEHPAGSKAWERYGLSRPVAAGGWSIADAFGWTCSVAQGNYGHKANKSTWLYLVGRNPPPELTWGKSGARGLIDKHSYEKYPDGVFELTSKEATATPIEFAKLLIELARGCKC